MQSAVTAWILWACLWAGSAAACGTVAPIKLNLRGEVLASTHLAELIKVKLPCRQESSALACMCRPVANALIEVTVGFRWRDVQMSQVSERRLRELGDGLRSIEGYGGATVKLVPIQSSEKPKRTVLQQRKAGVTALVALAAQPAAGSQVPESKASARWVRHKFVISAVFV